MKIALIGYGKMGHEIEKIALQRAHSINLKIDKNNADDFTTVNLAKCDVAIEFTTPETAFENYLKCFAANIPVISGTTGWLSKQEELKNICTTQNKTFFYASNFSLGVNIFFRINQMLAKLMNNYSQYEVDITEVHHTQKLDAPSGTAITLANQIISEIERKNTWKLDGESKEEIKITALRQGTVPGTHIINYTSAEDTIKIEHCAHSRAGFALGAVLAAEFSFGKKGWLTMNDMLKF